jgi:hypothetical protein
MKRKVTHSYYLNYPDHEPRSDDPHYRDFEAYRRKTKDKAQCAMFFLGECKGGLELHHSHIEFALINAVDLSLLERDYPGVSNPDEVGAWVESAANLLWLCQWHHRSVAGVHRADASNYEAQRYVHKLISAA